MYIHYIVYVIFILTRLWLLASFGPKRRQHTTTLWVWLYKCLAFFSITMNNSLVRVRVCVWVRVCVCVWVSRGELKSIFNHD